jgi:hypothetical protein
LGAGFTTFSGAYLSGTTYGSLSILIPVASTTDARSYSAASQTRVVATGTAKPVGGTSVGLTGTFDASTGSHVLSGGGYGFNGQASMVHSVPTLDGAWSGPGGLGSFATSSGSQEHPVSVYCGDYSNLGNSIHGKIGLMRVEWWLRGFALSAGGELVTPLQGTITNDGTNAVSFSGSGFGGLYNFSGTGSLNFESGTGGGRWRTIFSLDVTGVGDWSAVEVP